MTNRPLVTVDWLHQHLGDDAVRIIDASWHMPATGRDPVAEFEEGHIPGAVYFDIDRHATPSHLPHMLPSADQFARVAGELGIAEQDVIVVYDTAGLFSAARVWWMFRYFGAERVMILDGGLPAWIEAGHELEPGASRPQAATFHVRSSRFAVADHHAVLQASTAGTPLILDARSFGRYQGTEKETREGLRSGRIPGSRSMPFTELVDNGRLRPDHELKSLLAACGMSPDKAAITTCGSGVTAAIISLALECIGVEEIALYDGSWTEWGAREELPIETG